MRSTLNGLRRTAAALAVSLLFLPAGASAQTLQSGEPEALAAEGFIAPSWSPDGSRLAVTRAKYAGLYVIDVATGAVDTLTDEPAAGYGFSWSPDGSGIVTRVARFESGGRTDAVKVFYVESGAVEQLTEYREDLSSLPRWDATGGRVLIYVDRSLEVAAAQTAKNAAANEEPVVIPGRDGLLRAFPAQQRVEPLDAFRDRHILNLTTSPDGSRVAFEVLGGNLYVMNAEGTGIVDLGEGNRPSWSPDGEWIVFMRTADDGHMMTESDLFAVRTDGSATVRLTRSPDRLEVNPSWSPDGARIAYDDLSDSRIYLLPVSN